jgi:hypothetical protein
MVPVELTPFRRRSVDELLITAGLAVAVVWVYVIVSWWESRG